MRGDRADYGRAHKDAPLLNQYIRNTGQLRSTGNWKLPRFISSHISDFADFFNRHGLVLPQVCDGVACWAKQLQVLQRVDRLALIDRISVVTLDYELVFKRESEAASGTGVVALFKLLSCQQAVT